MIRGLLDPESEKVRSLEMSVDEIREAKDDNKGTTDSYAFVGVSSTNQIQDLECHLSNDSQQRQLYEMRAKILKDKVSALNEAERKGRNKEKLNIAKNLLDILDDETIALKTGLTVEQIQNLRK